MKISDISNFFELIGHIFFSFHFLKFFFDLCYSLSNVIIHFLKSIMHIKMLVSR